MLFGYGTVAEFQNDLAAYQLYGAVCAAWETNKARDAVGLVMCDDNFGRNAKKSKLKWATLSSHRPTWVPRDALDAKRMRHTEAVTTGAKLRTRGEAARTRRAQEAARAPR